MNERARPIGSEEPVEIGRLREDAVRRRNWKRWGPYLAERQWGTVREDYSENGACWDYFPHDMAPARAYRWGEDGILGITDRECRLCFALALWNGRAPILKERLFGLSNHQGNHGEDVKELYYYLDATPCSTYLRGLYKYPQAEFPYDRLLAENLRRGRPEPEYEIADTGVFNEGRYFDVEAEYAKPSPNDILIRITVTNRGPEPATLHLLPTLWFRNGWSWGATHDGTFPKPSLLRAGAGHVECRQETLGLFHWRVEDESAPLLFTENETNHHLLFRDPDGADAFTKDAFHRYVIAGRQEAVNPEGQGTKAAALFEMELGPGESRVIRLRLSADDEAPAAPFAAFDETFAECRAVAEAFYEHIRPRALSAQEALVWRQAYAGLLWTKQFYHYVVGQWLEGDPAQPPPPQGRRKQARNRNWKHLFNYDIVSMPDKWEFPWYAAWDLAFHMLPMARVDPHFAKEQLKLFMREWYMHPDGAIPAYEFNFSDVNPPVHAWACWRVYKMTGPRGARDVDFLASCFHKLLLNFTWWVNRKGTRGRHIFGGGFLGLDNIGIFDRSIGAPDGRHLEQADGTAWMAFYCMSMLSIALELAGHDRSYEDIASKFFEHFAAITHAMNALGGTGLWDDVDGFYYDQLYDEVTHQTAPIRIRSIVGLIPLFACGTLDAETIRHLPGFRKRMNWFLEHQRDLARSVSVREVEGRSSYFLSVAPRQRLERVLRYVFDEREFLSDYGIRSLSKAYERDPYTVRAGGRHFRIRYEPGESGGSLFGGNSNWRGPIWFPMNYLLVESLQRYCHFWGDDLAVTDSDGRRMNLSDAANDLQRRLVSIFLPGPDGRRPLHGDVSLFSDDPHFRDLLLFHEYFHGDNGRGCGASHQTGWTALVAHCIENLCHARSRDTQAGAVRGVFLGDNPVEPERDPAVRWGTS